MSPSARSGDGLISARRLTDTLLLAGTLSVLWLTGCQRSEGVPEWKQKWNDAKPRPGEEIEDPPGHRVLGATTEVLDYGRPCCIQASWSVRQVPDCDFRAILRIEVGKVFPLRDGMAALGTCDPTERNPKRGRPTPSFAYLELDPPDYFRWAAPAPGDVYIPFGGEAVLDGDQHAIATLEPTEDAGAQDLKVTVSLSSPSRQDEGFPHLGVGDSFRWGKSQAKIVRVIEPVSRAVGWVEVVLSDGRGRGAAARDR
jgi:hypothetical protein